MPRPPATTNKKKKVATANEKPFMATGRLYKDKKIKDAIDTMRQRKKMKDNIEKKRQSESTVKKDTPIPSEEPPNKDKQKPNSIRITNSRLQYTRKFDSGEIIDGLITSTEKLKDSKMYLNKLTKLLKLSLATNKRVTKVAKHATVHSVPLEDISLADAFTNTEHEGMTNIPSNVATLMSTLTENIPQMERMCNDSIKLTNRLIEMHQKFVMRVKYSDAMIEEFMMRLFSEIKSLNSTINHLNSGQQLRSLTYTVPVHHRFESGPTVATVSVPEEVVTSHTPEAMANLAHQSRPWESSGARAPSSNQQEYGVVNPFSSERSVDHIFYVKKNGDRINVPTRRE